MSGASAAKENAGFNLKYESTTGWKGADSWYTIPDDERWHTKTWTITDPQFVGKWGFNFGFDSDGTQFSKYHVKSVTVAKEGDPGGTSAREARGGE